MLRWIVSRNCISATRRLWLFRDDDGDGDGCRDDDPTKARTRFALEVRLRAVFSTGCGIELGRMALRGVLR
jgi:hypothetical protein